MSSIFLVPTITLASWPTGRWAYVAMSASDASILGCTTTYDNLINLFFTAYLHDDTTEMGALFSSYGASAGNSAVIDWVKSIFLDVVVIPSIVILCVYTAYKLMTGVGPLNTIELVVLSCMCSIGIFVGLWVYYWATNSNRIAFVRPGVLQRLSLMFVKQSTEMEMLKNRIGSKQVTDKATLDSFVDSSNRIDAQNRA
jgi:hypothetical protein